MQMFFGPEVLEHTGQLEHSPHQRVSHGHGGGGGSWDGILLTASVLRSLCFFLSHTTLDKEPDPSEFTCSHRSQGNDEIP